MITLAAVGCGTIVGVGLFIAVIGLQKHERRQKLARLSKFKAQTQRLVQFRAGRDGLVMVGLAVVLGLGAWYATGWLAAAVIGAAAGVAGPMMRQAPKKRQAITDEIEAYSQWTEQIRDLVAASGSLYEAVILSSEQAPPRLRPMVAQMASLARTVGLPAALDWFAAQADSPYADRLVLGMRIAWDSGARVTEAFNSTARSMRAEVEMRRRNEVANARAWTQVVSMLGVTVGSVTLMFALNKAFFDPFGTTVGQIVLLGVGALIFGNVYWVIKLSESGQPIRLLATDKQKQQAAVMAALKETKDA